MACGQGNDADFAGSVAVGIGNIIDAADGTGVGNSNVIGAQTRFLTVDKVREGEEA